MKKNIDKIISLVLVIFMITFMLCVPVFAREAEDSSQANDTSGGSASDIGALPAEVQTTAENVLGVLLVIGAAVCIGKCIQIGIMMVSSSANARSDAKSAMIPWIIGAIILSAFSLIGNTVIDIIGSGLNGDVLGM